jgi:hypothetical protein
MTDNTEIARMELSEALGVLSDEIPGSAEFDRAAEAVIAVANAWYRAGESSKEPASS